MLGTPAASIAGMIWGAARSALPAAPIAQLTGSPVGNVVDALALLMLGSAFLLVAVQRLTPAVQVLAAQSLLLTVMVGLVAAASGAVHLWLAAGLTLVVKVLLVPRILSYVVQRLKIRREPAPVLPVRLTLVFAAGLSVLAYWVTRPLDLALLLPAGHALPVAVACILLGGLLMVTRRKALTQLIGLMVMENGLYLAAMVVTSGMPLLVELGIFFDLLVGVLVMGIIIFRINQTFDTINTDRLQRLRH
jgi:hydrogenase-4 component E